MSIFKKYLLFLFLLSPLLATSEDILTGLKADDISGKRTEKRHNKQHKALKAYFATNNSFDPNSRANQAFKNECPNQYAEFERHARTYLSLSSVKGNSLRIVEERKTAESNIKASKEACGRVIYNNYNLIFWDKARPFQEDHLQSWVESSHSGSPESVKTIAKQLAGEEDFDARCLNPAREVTIGYVEDARNCTDVCYNPKSLLEFGEFLSKHTSDCTEQRKEWTSLLASEDWKNFVSLPDRCEAQSDCVGKLRVMVGLDKTPGSEKSIFETCGEDPVITKSCCGGDVKSCEHFGLKVVFEEFVNQDICSSDNRQMKDKLRGEFAGQLAQACNGSRETCQTSCKDRIEEFKKNFQECFFLPDLTFQAYSFHLDKVRVEGKEKSNPCGKELQEIVNDKFNENANRFKITEINLYNLDQKIFSRIVSSTEKECGEISKKSESDKDFFSERAARMLAERCQKIAESPHSSQDAGGGSLPSANIGRGYYSSGHSSNYQGSSSSTGLGGEGSGDSYRGLASNEDEEHPNLGSEYYGENSLTDLDVGHSLIDLEGYKGPPNPFEDNNRSIALSGSDCYGVVPSNSHCDSNSSSSGSFYGSEKSSGSAGAEDEDEYDFNSIGNPAFRGSHISANFSRNSSYQPQRSFGERLWEGTKDSYREVKNWVLPPSLPKGPTSVKEAFNIHGQEVNLMERQRELFEEACKIHGCELYSF